jgi:hypothetical protein
MSFHLVSVVLTLVQTKQIKIYLHKRNNKKHSTNSTKHGKYKYTFHKSTQTIVRTPLHTHTHISQNPYIHTPTHTCTFTDVTWCFIVLMNCSTCFGHSYAHHQEPETIPVLVCGAWCQRCWWSAGRCRAAGYVSRERERCSPTHTPLPCTYRPTTSTFGTTHRTLELI